MRFLASLICLVGAAFSAQAAGIQVAQVWARATAPGASMGAVYMTVHNAGAQADRLLSVTSEVAKLAEVHESITDASGTTRMQAHAQGLAIPAKSVRHFAPGGLHIMLMGLSAPLALSDEFPLTLVFERAGKVKVSATVMAGPPEPDSRAQHAHEL